MSHQATIGAVRRLWDREARAFTERPDGADWKLLSTTTADPVSTYSFATYQHRTTGLEHTVSVLRDGVPEPADRLRAIRRQLVTALARAPKSPPPLTPPLPRLD